MFSLCRAASRAARGLRKMSGDVLLVWPMRQAQIGCLTPTGLLFLYRLWHISRLEVNGDRNEAIYCSNRNRHHHPCRASILDGGKRGRHFCIAIFSWHSRARITLRLFAASLIIAIVTGLGVEGFYA